MNRLIPFLKKGEVAFLDEKYLVNVRVSKKIIKQKFE